MYKIKINLIFSNFTCAICTFLQTLFDAHIMLFFHKYNDIHSILLQYIKLTTKVIVRRNKEIVSNLYINTITLKKNLFPARAG